MTFGLILSKRDTQSKNLLYGTLFFGSSLYNGQYPVRFFFWQCACTYSQLCPKYMNDPFQVVFKQQLEANEIAERQQLQLKSLHIKKYASDLLRWYFMFLLKYGSHSTTRCCVPKREPFLWLFQFCVFPLHTFSRIWLFLVKFINFIDR